MASEPDRFLGLEDGEAMYERSEFAVLPIPYDSTASFLRGARHAPRAIITASQHAEVYDDELGGEFISAGIATLNPMVPNAAGPEAMHNDIREAAGSVLADGKFLLSLGGDHSITSGLVSAAGAKYKDLSVLQIDAHADLRDSFQGSKYSHAAVMRRIYEMKIPFVGVGIRSYSSEEATLMQRDGIRPVTALECRASPDWVERAVDRLTDHVYVTLDIDAFDPAYAPGTGTPEPGGLDWFRVTRLLRAVAECRTIVAADIVEVIPLPGQVVTEFLAARLAYKVISYAQAAR